MKKKTKIIILAIGALYVIGNMQQNDNKKNENSSKVGDTTAESESFTESMNFSSESVNIFSETDLEIITRTGHPTYYGSVISSHTIWDDVPKNKIIFADKNETFGNETIISMSAYKNSDLIRSIHITFSNFENPINYTIEDVLPIVSSYMPYDIIDKYYHYTGSRLIAPNEDNSKREKYYTFSYGLTEEGRSSYYEKIHEYSGSIDVVITTDDNDIVDNFYIDFGVPRWMSSLDLNKYHQETWECNLRNNSSETTEAFN